MFYKYESLMLKSIKYFPAQKSGQEINNLKEKDMAW